MHPLNVSTVAPVPVLTERFIVKDAGVASALHKFVGVPVVLLKTATTHAGDASVTSKETLIILVIFPFLIKQLSRLPIPLLLSNVFSTLYDSILVSMPNC